MMLISNLENGGLNGYVTFERNSYIVRVWVLADWLKGREEHRYVDPIYYMSFGDGVRAEDRLLELLEHPAWTILKYGK